MTLEQRKEERKERNGGEMKEKKILSLVHMHKPPSKLD
jgi:hypothetical protein